MKPKKIAFVYDRINKFGGAERVLLAMHAIWPDAPLYTAVYDKSNARWASGFRINHTFLQHSPFAKRHHELYAWLTPMAFESFSFDDYDVVISVTSAEAKNIITKPRTLHICYCLTPTRYLWSGNQEYEKNPSIGLPKAITGNTFRALRPLLRKWDIIGSCRPDNYIAISNAVKNRIQTYYHRPVDRIIYPPVDLAMFGGRKKAVSAASRDFFLLVSRLVPYKRIDIVVKACNVLRLPLVIVGEGAEKANLRRLAGPTVQFVGAVTDRELVDYYRGCRAFVFAGSEDFGIAAVEAQASGKPVIAYRESGIAEIVRDGKTGSLFDTQSVGSLVRALKQFDQQWYDDTLCRENAKRFSQERFNLEMKQTVEELYNRYI